MPPLQGLFFWVIRCYKHAVATRLKRVLKPKSLFSPQATTFCRYATEEGFEVFNVFASYPVRLGGKSAEIRRNAQANTPSNTQKYAETPYQSAEIPKQKHPKQKHPQQNTEPTGLGPVRLGNREEIRRNTQDPSKNLTEPG